LAGWREACAASAASGPAGAAHVSCGTCGILLMVVSTPCNRCATPCSPDHGWRCADFNLCTSHYQLALFQGPSSAGCCTFLAAPGIICSISRPSLRPYWFSSPLQYGMALWPATPVVWCHGAAGGFSTFASRCAAGVQRSGAVCSTPVQESHSCSCMQVCDAVRISKACALVPSAVFQGTCVCPSLFLCRSRAALLPCSLWLGVSACCLLAIPVFLAHPHTHGSWLSFPLVPAFAACLGSVWLPLAFGVRGV
jgi:hypothetical protein